ncbi:MAG: radical SAM protein [Candidatus Omnitrophica bacterium]|nr:radical SAM protein [Candidatus Omnitrophota bacterium]MBU4478299.1 radical SAM protein [Candidatus Omnitrophota bacterium]MCG2703366.1 radical SAM protein [Candidatus Omnitrophota bacterium]
MTKKILLVNPWICDFAAYDLWMFPLGLLHIAAVLKTAEVSLGYVDFLGRQESSSLVKQKDRTRTTVFGTGHFYKQPIPKPAVLSRIPRGFFRYGLAEEAIEKKLPCLNPDVILVTSGMTYWHVGVQQTIAVLRKHFKRAPIVLGGVYATLCPGHAKKHSGADIVFGGGDFAQILRLLSSLLEIPLETSLRQMPLPDFSLLKRQDALPILGSWGCPFRCTYCASRVLYPNFKQRTPDEIISMILYCIKQYGTKDFIFYDDALLVNSEEFIKPVLKAVIAWGLDVRFHTPNGLHARFIDEELSGLLFRAGFKTIRLSLESSSLDELKKNSDNKVSNEHIVRAIRLLKSGGFKKEEIGVYTLIGFPGQREENIVADMDFVHSLGAQIDLSSYSLVPQSAQWNDFIRKGIIAENTDPLLLSHTVFPLLFGGFDTVLMKKLRNYAGILNRK